MTTLLQAVNETLARLREDSVSTYTETAYSKLIAKYINDFKRQVEDSWDWDCLSTTITVNCVPGQSTYTVTGSGRRMKNVIANNTTSKYRLRNAPIQWIIDQQQLSTVQNSAPSYFAWNGWNGTDSKIELFSTPDLAYVLKFNMNVPQVDLSNNEDIIKVPSDPVILGAYARAIAERGEDGGLNSSEAYLLFKSALADAIAIEQTRTPEWDTFEGT